MTEYPKPALNGHLCPRFAELDYVCNKCGKVHGYSRWTLDNFIAMARQDALEEAAQAAQPDDSYVDEWFKAKADAVRRIRALADKEPT